MTDLQLGLLIIGAVAVIGVLLYNRIQERSARRAAERAFGSGHTDVLMEEGRREPAGAAPPPHVARSRASPPTDAMPDDLIDYVIELTLARPTSGVAVLEAWAPIERRFARRALLAARNDEGWRLLHPGDAGACAVLAAALQLVSRSGPIQEAELVEFRSAVETLATDTGASVVAPEMRSALDAAHELDRTCADADIQVALHVTGRTPANEDLSQYQGQPFQVVATQGGAILTLDVPRTLEIGRSYEAMARAAIHLAAATGGKVVDDNGNALDDRALAAIGGQLDAVRQSLAQVGIETGSPLALRLFS